MKKSNTKTKSKPKTAKKNRSPKPAVVSQPDADPFSPTRVLAGWSANSQRSSLDLIGEEVVNQLNRLVELAEREDPEEVGQVIERVGNHLVDILQTIEKRGGNAGLRTMAQEQMLYYARRFSDAAFGVVARTPHEASEIMTLSLVKFIAGQCDKLKIACIDNPQTFRWIAEQNVFWPGIRGLYDSYQDGFPEARERLNLGGGLPINRKRKKALDMETAANSELLRFFQFVMQTPQAAFGSALPLFSKEKKKIALWERVKPLPVLPPLSRNPKTMAQWKKCLTNYLELKICVLDKVQGEQVELKINKQRILQSGDFEGVKGRPKVKDGGEKEGVVWDEIKKALHQALYTMAQP